MKREISTISGNRCSLRLLRETDLPLTLKWRNKDRIRKRLFCSDPVSAEAHATWFQGYSERDDDFVFIIEDGSSIPIGQIALYRIDWRRQTAEFGRLLIGEDEALGRGFASEAAELILKLAFEHFQLQRVCLEVFQTNDAAIRLYERIGFTTDARCDDVVQMSICRSGKSE